MKRKLLLIFLILSPVVLYAQINQTDENGQRQGLWKKEYPNGRLMYEGNFSDDKPVGEWRRYHEGGRVKAIINYSEVSDTAYAQLFDAFGKKIAEGTYLNEKREGTWFMYSNDQKIAEEQYKNNLKNGLSKRFYDSGELMETTEWQNGKKEGDYQVFFKNGNPYLQCKYSNNLRNGLCLTSFQNGRTEMEASYKNSLRNGEWKFYNENGELLYSLFYNEGILLNPEVKDSIDNLELKNMETGRESIIDPEKFMQDPSEYMRKMNIY